MGAAHTPHSACVTAGKVKCPAPWFRTRARRPTGWRETLLQDELAAFVRPANAGEEGHAEQVDAQGLIGLNEGGNIAYHDVLDFDPLELDQRRAGDAISRGDPDVVIARRRMDTE